MARPGKTFSSYLRVVVRRTRIDLGSKLLDRSLTLGSIMLSVSTFGLFAVRWKEVLIGSKAILSLPFWCEVWKERFIFDQRTA